MALLTLQNVPQYDENNLPETVRQLLTAYKALTEQLTYVLQNIDTDNGAATSEDVTELNEKMIGAAANASNAYANANAAVEAAQNAYQIAAQAKTTADNANTTAAETKQSALTAQQSAASAQTAAENAAASAKAAKSSAQTAAESAETANETAAQAKQTADSAKEMAQQAHVSRTAIHSSTPITTSTAMSYTNVSVTIPAKSYFSVSAVAHYDSDKPKAIGFYEYTSTSSNAIETCSVPVGNYNAVVTLSGYSGENARELHVFASYENGGRTCNIVTEGFYIT